MNMEQYPVPQFIEEEARIISFLTIKQFLYIVVAGAVILFLYYLLPFYLFVVVAILLGGGAGAMGFLKVNGVPLLTIMLNSFGFITGAKNYTWKKKESLYPFKTIERASLKKIEEEPILKVGQKGSLKKLRTKVELRTK